MKRHGYGLLVAGIVALTCAAPAALAEVQKIDATGYVHRVDVESVSIDRYFYTQLRYTRTAPDGTREVMVVPGTDDLAWEREPAIEIAPYTGNVVFVWVRNDGTGYELFVTRRDGTTWLPTRRLLAVNGDARRPQIRISTNLLHVAWRQDNGPVQVPYRASFDRVSLDLAFGPEQVPLAPAGTSTGLDPASVDPPWWNKYFAASAPGSLPGEPGWIVIWGVRDEPVPIDYVYYVPVPKGVYGVIQAEASFIGSRFVLWFYTGDRFFYSVRSNQRWSDIRLVDLSGATSVSDAKIQVREMVLRGGI